MRLARLEVPGAVVIGEDVWLKCDFDLEGDELYSVKWYKNNVEFYRYQPRDRLHGQMYELLGVYVELSRSNASHVFLKRSDLNTEGTYGCEVSSEAPHFKTVKAEDELRVYVLPKEPPVIEGADSMNEVGDRINVTCSSGPSKPAATLSWYINGIQANATFVRKYSSIRHYSGLQTSQAGLAFTVAAQDFDGGKLRLRCVATISQVYSSGSEELIIGDRGQASGSHHEQSFDEGHSTPGSTTPGLRKKAAQHQGHESWTRVSDSDRSTQLLHIVLHTGLLNNNSSALATTKKKNCLVTQIQVDPPILWEGGDTQEKTNLIKICLIIARGSYRAERKTYRAAARLLEEEQTLILKIFTRKKFNKIKTTNRKSRQNARAKRKRKQA